MSRWISAFASLAAMAVSGCAAVGPNFVSPGAPTPRGYAAPGEPVPSEVALDPSKRAAGPWWRDLGSNRLDAVMTEALAGNQTVAQAVAALDRARAEGDVAGAERKPRIDANVGAQRERINTQAFGITGFPSPTISLFSIGATVNYGLDLFGGTRRRIEAVNADAQAQARRADAAYLTLTGNVALQAVRIAALNEEVRVLGDIAADDRASIAIIRAAEAGGGEAATAGLGGQAQLQADLALLPPVEQQISEAKHAFAGLVGKAPGEWAAPEFQYSEFRSPETIALTLPSSLIRSRPDILAAEADLHADTARVGVAAANLYPNLNLVAGLTQEALTPGSIFSFDSTAYTFGATATAPIFHGGALRAERRAAEAQARASLARYRQTVATAFVQVADVLTAIANDDVRLTTLREAGATASASLAAAEDAYRLGGGARAQIVVDQRRVDQARLAVLDAEGLRLEDIVSLYAATASDWGHAASEVNGTLR